MVRQNPTTVATPARAPPRWYANGIRELVSIARRPPAASAAARSPVEAGTMVANAQPAAEARPQLTTTASQSRPVRPRLQPALARSADGAIACGTLETRTAARKLALTGVPAAIWIPK